MKLTPFLLFDGNCAYEKNVFLFLRKHGLCRRAETSAPARLSLSKPEQAERAMMQNLPTGTVTLLFTDIAGSTRLLTQLGDRYASVLSQCRQVLRAVFGQWNGNVVDTQGDAFFVVFARATDAVSAAVAAQRVIASYAFPNGAVVQVRIGLHTGEPQRTADGYVGLDVHRAARMMSAGHGGQV